MLRQCCLFTRGFSDKSSPLVGRAVGKVQVVSVLGPHGLQENGAQLKGQGQEKVILQNGN